MDRPVEGTEVIEVSGDAAVIADGLRDIAEALRELARAVRAEEMEELKDCQTYMDGTPIDDLVPNHPKRINP